jgi:hypothetical protein
MVDFSVDFCDLEMRVLWTGEDRTVLPGDTLQVGPCKTDIVMMSEQGVELSRYEAEGYFRLIWRVQEWPGWDGGAVGDEWNE